MPFSRRALLGGLVTAAVASAMPARPEAAASGSGTEHQRSARALQVRLEAARFEQQFPLAAHPSNGDEDRFFNRIGNYSKGLPHDHRGEVDRVAYESMLTALATGDPADFERITIGDGARLVNPQAGLAFDILGPDSHALGMAPPPAFNSAEQAGEIAENYWMALARDVPFAH